MIEVTVADGSLKAVIVAVLLLEVVATLPSSSRFTSQRL